MGHIPGQPSDPTRPNYWIFLNQTPCHECKLRKRLRTKKRRIFNLKWSRRHNVSSLQQRQIYSCPTDDKWNILPSLLLPQQPAITCNNNDVTHSLPLKLIDQLRTTRWTPLDYWQTDNSNGLVIVIRNYHWLNSANWVLISTCSAPLVQTGEIKQFSLFDLDLQPKSSKGQERPWCHKSRPKVKRFKQESAHRQTDRQTHTHGRYQTYYLPCYAVDNNMHVTDWRLKPITLIVTILDYSQIIQYKLLP